MPSARPHPTLLLTTIALLVVSSCQQDETPPAPTERCPLVPMKIIASAKGFGTSTAVALNAEGGFSTGFLPGETIAHFDPRGCLIGPDGPWVELTRTGKLWTQRALMPVEGEEIVLGKRRLRIQPDGAVIGIDEHGQSEPNDITSLRIEGYSPQARCCAQVLLTAYLAMMPSMAVADGVAETLPPPADSVCKGLPSPRTRH